MLLLRSDRFTEMKPSDLWAADARSLCKAQPVLVIERQAHHRYYTRSLREKGIPQDLSKKSELSAKPSLLLVHRVRIITELTHNPA